MDILRCQHALYTNAAFQIVQPGSAGQFIQDHAPVSRQHLRPVMVRPQIGSVHKNVQRLTAFRRHPRFGACGGSQVARGVGRRLAAAIDKVEFLFRVLRKHEIMVRQMVVSPVQPQVQHHA